MQFILHVDQNNFRKRENTQLLNLIKLNYWCIFYNCLINLIIMQFKNVKTDLCTLVNSSIKSMIAYPRATIEVQVDVSWQVWVDRLQCLSFHCFQHCLEEQSSDLCTVQVPQSTRSSINHLITPRSAAAGWPVLLPLECNLHCFFNDEQRKKT